MGCCESCLKSSSKDYDEDDPTEHDPLITPVNGQPATQQFRESQTIPQAPEQHPEGDERSALSRILHKTASDTVDVSAAEGRGLEQHEFHDKARQYRFVIIDFDKSIIKKLKVYTCSC
ncbi:ragulator complex protein LAMTOR1-like [Mercenaria mercenaria]|uniref:ragulator complex protein LAMTOR1-like n=1 Tax=Mercenaria mercenaria TaxID=6596 RepID=UPI00234EBF88|nr:ragulator complex protein LAMTOR1-like [Mercenaria mercenaria]